MENSKIFKKLVIVMLSLVLVAVCSTSVFAADDDLFLSVNSTGNTANNTTDNNTNTDNNTTSNTSNNTTNSNTNSNSSLTANNTTNNTTRNTTNNTSNTNRNVNELAKTGLSNTNGVVALVLVVCGVSAIYSYKKVNDYKKL